MAEHLNAEIALHSITDISIAMEWLKATYLYQRVFKNPNYYGMSTDLTKDKIERKLQDLCIKELNGLKKYQLIFMDDDGFYLTPTRTGHLMAKYYISYDTMKQFFSLTGTENLAEMISLFSSCKEFEDIQLRVNEKKCLNDLNRSKLSSVRFPLPGKIKTKQMKINCLIQATFGCLAISDPSLNQDAARIFKNSQRLSRCLVEYLATNETGFVALHSAVILSKCFKARLWENSKFVSRQLEKIGVTFSNLLVNAGITTIENILKMNPRQIELILKRNPPFGSVVVNSAQKIPRYSLQVEQNPPFSNYTANISITVMLENAEDVSQGENKNKPDCYILIGDANNKIVLYEKIRLLLQKPSWTKKLDITKAGKEDEINIYVISDTFVGVDINKSYSVIYRSLDANKNEKNKIEKLTEENKNRIKFSEKNTNKMAKTNMRDCNHKCKNKGTCSHPCCKIGVAVAIPKKSQISNFMEQLQNKMSASPKKVKIGVGTFSENMKVLQGNNCNDAPLNDNLTTHKNSKHNSMFLEQTALSENYCNYYVTQDYKKQKEDQDMEFKETHLEPLSFDINFKEFEDKSWSEYENSEEELEVLPKTQTFDIFPQKNLNWNKCTRKIEEWNDPVAAEETLTNCLNLLTNCF